MSTSQHGRRVLFSSTRMDSGNDVSAFALKLMANNAHHYADEKCNHLVNWVAPHTAVMASGVPYIEQVAADGQWRHLVSFGAFPITQHGSGRGYRMRLALAGSVGGVATASFAALLTEGSDVGNLEALTTGYGAIFQTSSSAPSWLNVFSGAAFFKPHQSFSDRALRIRSTRTDTGGAPVTVDTMELFLRIYSKTTVDDVPPRLWAVHLSEYVGL